MIALALAGIASAILSALGSVGGTLIQAEYNKEEAQRQRNFEERMSNTAIQRQIADANKAGISPSLVLGGGASTPMGTSAQISAPDIGRAMQTSTGQILSYIENRDRLDALKEINKDRLDTYEDVSTQRMHNQRTINDRKLDAYERMNIEKGLSKEKTAQIYKGMSNTAR